MSDSAPNESLCHEWKESLCHQRGGSASLNYYKHHFMWLVVRNGKIWQTTPPWGNYWPGFPSAEGYQPEIRDGMPFSLLQPIPPPLPFSELEFGSYERIKYFGRDQVSGEPPAGDYLNPDAPVFDPVTIYALRGPTGALVWKQTNADNTPMWNGWFQAHAESFNLITDSWLIWQKMRMTFSDPANGFFAKANVWANWQGAHGWRPFIDPGVPNDYQQDKITIEDVQLINTFTASARAVNPTEIPWDFPSSIPDAYHSGLIAMIIICIADETPAAWTARTGIPIS